MFSGGKERRRALNGLTIAFCLSIVGSQHRLVKCPVICFLYQKIDLFGVTNFRYGTTSFDLTRLIKVVFGRFKTKDKYEEVRLL